MSKHPPLEPRPTAKVADGNEMYERVMRCYPRTMAHLAEYERREQEQNDADR
jgi:hypothetical protein